MRKIVLSLFLLGALISGLHAQQQTYLLPQVANGGNFRTTFIVTNTSATDTAMVGIRLTADNGSNLTVTIPGDGGGTSSQFNFSLGPGNSKVLQTDGSGGLIVGAATITSNIAVGVLAIFSQFDAQGGLITEAGVGNAAPLTQFTIPVDASGSFSTGVALFNPGSSSVNYTAYLLDTAGRRRATKMDTLSSLAHRAAFTGEIFQGVTGFTQGSMSVIASAPLGAVALRLNNVPRLTLTTLPVIPGAFMGTDTNPPPTSYAGSFDGSFMESGGGKLTLILRQDGSQLTGGLCQEFSNPTVIRAASVQTTVPLSGPLSIDALALDGTGTRTMLSITGDGQALRGTFNTSSGQSGSFVLSQLPRSGANVTGSFFGTGWNAADLSVYTINVNARQNGDQFEGDLQAQTTLGLFTGSATGTVREDRIENLTLNLSTPLGPFTISGGSAFLTSDRSIICGSLEAGGLIDVRGSFVLRKRQQ